MARVNFRSRARQRGFLEWVIPAVVGAFAADEASDSVESTNNMSAEQAALNRDFNASEAAKAREFNSAEAVKNRAFQDTQFAYAKEYAHNMANTSYQRAVGDMRAAGLNPMLAYSQGGAPSPSIGPPSGATASSSPASSNSMPSFNAPAVAGLNAAQQAVHIGNLAKQGANIDADTALKNAQAVRETSSAQNLDASTKDIEYKLQNKVPEEIRLLRAEQGTHFWRQMVDAAQEQVLKLEKLLKHNQLGLTEAQTEYHKIHTLLLKLAEPQARNAANAQDSWWMRNVSPYLPDALKTGIIGTSIVR